MIDVGAYLAADQIALSLRHYGYRLLTRQEATDRGLAYGRWVVGHAWPNAVPLRDAILWCLERDVACAWEEQ